MSVRQEITSTPSEVDLLLCSARTHVDAGAAERIRTALQEKVRWDDLLATAARHRVTPLLYHSLSTICPEAVPRPVLERLRYYFHASDLNSRFLADELLRLLDLLAAHGIAALPLKGPVLAASAYGALALRQCGDLDMLVSRREVARAGELLLAHGYRPLARPAGSRQTSHLLKSKTRKDIAFVREDVEVCVELHWALFPQVRALVLDPAYIERHTEEVVLSGTPVRSLAPEAQLLFLCAHGAKHCWEKLNWICDVAELVRAHRQMDWEKVLAEARRLHSERLLLLGLHLAVALLEAPVPDAIRRRIQRDPRLPSLAARVRGWLFRAGDGPFERLEGHLFWLQARDSSWSGLPFFLHRTLTPTAADRRMLPLPGYLSFFYYLLRPVRLIGKYTRQALRRIGQRRSTR